MKINLTKAVEYEDTMMKEEAVQTIIKYLYTEIKYLAMKNIWYLSSYNT